MNNSNYTAQRPLSLARQQGAILLVSMIILVVMTVLGISTMDTTALEMKMASNTRDRMVAFQAAEAALVEAENFIEDTGFTQSQLYSTCTGANCFDPTCTNGLCASLEGTYDGGGSDGHLACVIDPPATPSNQAWFDTTLDVWETSGKHVQLSSGDVDLNQLTGYQYPKYIIEFLCYTDAGDGIFESALSGVSSEDYAKLAGAEMYRISALGYGSSGRANVMLQSTFRRIQ